MMSWSVVASLVVLGALFVCGSAQSCTNSLGDEPCDVLIAEEGCIKLNVRLACRLGCDACDSFEIANPLSLRQTAAIYGGNHVVTWDRLPFDCTARGEFTLVRNDRLGLRVHALFKRPLGMRTSVTKAISIRGGPGSNRLQIGVNDNLSSGATSEGQCKLIHWVGNTRVTEAQVAKLGGYGGIARIDQFGFFLYKMDVQEGARVTVTLRYAEIQGCYLDRVIVFMPERMKQGTRGLMGTPDNNLYNDWHSRSGSIFSVPARKSRYFLEAYNYCKRNWCIRLPGGSFLKYNGLGSFYANQHCNDGYSGLYNFASATTEMRKVCGNFNYECLHDAVSTGKASEGVETNLLIGEMETATVIFKRGLRIEPRAIRANKATTVLISVKLDAFVEDLEGFGVWKLNEDTLAREGEPLFILRDNGDVAEGDDLAEDFVFSNVNAITLGNGYAAGYTVIPLIRGSYRFNMQPLIFTLPLATRGFSPASGLTIPSTNNLRFELKNVFSIYIEVKYIWPEYQNDLDTGTRFFDGKAGYNCPGGPFIEHTSGDDDTTGGIETTNVQVGKAWSKNLWSSNTVIFLHAHWFLFGTGDGPVTVSIVAKQRGLDRPKANASMSMAVTPKRTTGCSANDPTTRVGRLTINKNPSGSYVFRLLPEI